jgi:hypothetical protein
MEPLINPIRVRAATYRDDIILSDVSDSMLIPLQDVDEVIAALRETRREITARVESRTKIRIYRSAA